MGLRCLTYGDLWGCCACGLRPMGLWQFRYLCIGLRCQTYGADLWGKAIAISMWDLWGPMGDLWGTYGGPMGDLWGRMGDLWGIYGAISCWYGIGRVLCMGLQRLIYEDLWGCCGCGVETMGIYGGAVAAVWDLWGSMGVLWLRCGTYGADLWG